MKQIFLSVVIPCFNEKANLQKGVLTKISNFLNNQKYSWEVVISDDGSNDGSTEIIKQFIKDNPRFRLLENKHLGKAGAVTTGMLKAIGENKLFTDMDQATPIEEINNLLPFLKGYDIAIGSRNTTRKGAPLTRVIMANSMIILRKLIIGLPKIDDTQCGFKLFKKESADKIFSKIKNLKNGFKEISGSAVTAGFDIELLLIAQNLDYKIKEVPVDWLYVETRRVNPLKDSIDGFLDLLRIKRESLQGLYK